MKGKIVSKIKIILIVFFIIFLLIEKLENSSILAETAMEGDQKVQLGIQATPKIDIALAKARTSTDVTQFETKIKDALKNLNVDTDDTEIHALEAEQVDISSSFSWKRDEDSSVGSITIGGTGQNVEMKGNPDIPGKTAMWIIPEGNQEQKFTFDYTIDFGDSFNAAGMLLRVKQVNSNLLTGYMLSFNHSGHDFYNNCSGNLGALWEFSYDMNNRTNIGKTLVQGINLNQNGKLTVSATDSVIKVSGTGVVNGEFTYNIPSGKENLIGNGYGFFSDHYDHNCQSIGSFKLTNINLTTTTVSSMTEVLRLANWRNNAYKFFVFITDEVSKELEEGSTSAELLTRIINENSYFIPWGTNANKAKMQTIIDSCGQGQFVDNTKGFDNSIQETGKYIKSILDQDLPDDMILLNEPLALTVTPESIATGTAEEPDWKYGKWKVEHDYEYYENNLGQYSKAGTYTTDLIRSFDKTGKFKITYKNQPVSPENILVHRRPTAIMNLSVQDKKVTAESISYDLDKFSEDNGISETKWRYKATDDTKWTESNLTQMEQGKTYMIQLKVKDHQNTWSYPVTKYVTTDQNSLPVAMFNIETDKVSKYENIKVTDSSYDPAGRKITNYKWEICRADNPNSPISTETTTSKSPKKTNFLNEGEGQYIMYLTVTNEKGQQSERYGRIFEITNDEIAPEFTATPTTCEWKQQETVNLQFTDRGGSGFEEYKYAVTNTQETTEDGWTEPIKEANSNINITREGETYLHVKGYDVAKNESANRILGPYKIDHTNPVVQVTADFTTIRTEPLDINIHSTDALSGVKKVTFNGQVLEGTENTVAQVSKNGTYDLQVEDIAGNIYTQSIEVSNIYNNCTAGLDHPIYSSTMDSCPICDLIEGLQITNDNVTYNSQEQKLTYDNPHDAEIVEYYNGSTTKPVEAGTYNYDLKVKYNEVEYNTGKTGQFTINPKTITIKDVTGKQRQYNATTTVELQGGVLEGVEASDVNDVQFVLPQTGTIPNKDVGQYNVTVPEITLEGKKAKNYKLTQPTIEEVSVTITPKVITIEDITGKERQYDGTTTVELQEGRLVGVEEIDKEKVQFVLPQTGTIDSKDVGERNIITIPEVTLEGEEAHNYSLTQPLHGNIPVTINPKEITIEGVKGKERQYNGTTIVELEGGNLVGVEEIDTEKVQFILPETGEIRNKNIGEYTVKIAEITLEGEEAKNYKLIQPEEKDIKVNIIKKDIQIENITAKERQYDGTTSVELEGGSLVGIEDVDKDKVEFILPKTGSIENKDVGEYYVTIPNIELTGWEANNYNLIQPQENTLKVTISKRVITIEGVKGKDRRYNGESVVEIQGGKLKNVVAGEDVRPVIPKTGIAQSSKTGTWTVTIEKIELEGEDIANYELIQPETKDIIVIISRARQPKIHVEPYVSELNNEKHDQIKAKISPKNKEEQVIYTKQVSNDKIRYGDNIEITIGIYNEGDGSGFANKITNYIPEGLEFVENDKVNEEYEWKETKENTIETHILENSNGEENEIKGLTDEEIDYREVKIVLKVIEPNLVKEVLQDKTTIEVVDIEGKEAINTEDSNKDKDENERMPEYGDDIPEKLEEDGWKKETENGKEVWTTDPTDPSNPEKWVDPSDPENELDPSEQIYPVYSKEIKVTRNIYLNTHPTDDPLTGKVYRSFDESSIVPAEINLGTAEEVTIEGKAATPKFWSTSSEPDPEDTTGQNTQDSRNEETVKLDGIAHLTKSAEYFMSYKYTEEITYTKPDGTEGKAKQDVNLGSTGEEKREDAKIPEEDKRIPEDLKEDGWNKDQNSAGKDVWTTDPTDPSNPEKWVDPTNPDSKIDPTKPIYPVYYKDIKVTRNIYLNTHPVDDPLLGTAYRCVDEDTIVPAKVNLGTSKNINEQDYTAVPKMWVTDLNSDEARENGIKPNGEVSLLHDEEYYMVYSYKVTTKMPDENGQMQEKEIEIEVNSDGEKKNPNKGEVDFPENPKTPEGWENPDENTEFKGWVKGEENKDNPDAPVIDPETEIPEEGDEYFPKFTKTITAIRYIYDNELQGENILKDENGKDLTGTVTAIGDNIIPANIDLGTTQEITIKDKTATPKFWTISPKANVKDTTANNSDTTINEEAVAINGTAHLTKNATYYMLYSYKDTVTYTKPDQSQGTIEVEINVNTKGEERRNENVFPGDDVPEDLKEKGWKQEKGTGKEETGNGIEEGKDIWTTDPTDPSNKEKWIDPTDPENGVDPDEPIHPVYVKDITVTRNIYLNTHPSDDPLTGKAYRSIGEDTIIPAKINLGTAENAEINGKQAEPKLWVTEVDSKEAKEQGINLNEEVSLLENEEYYMLYSYKAKIKVPDETGEVQEKEVELEIKPDGERNSTETGEEQNGGLDLPENPKKPEGWKDPDGNTEFEGWVKGEEDKDNPDAPVIDPETEVPEEGDEYFPKFTRTITVIRYVYDSEIKGQKVLKDENGQDLTGKVTAIGDNIIPAKINLGTTDSVEIEGKIATPKIWVTEVDSKEAEEQGINLNGEVSLLENEEYYMIYSTKIIVKVPDENGEMQQKEVEIEIKPDGEKNDTKTEEEQGGILDLPENPKPPEGWEGPGDKTKFEGWVKGEENKDNPDAPVIDPETEVPEEGDEYFPKFTKTVTAIRYVYDSETQGRKVLKNEQGQDLTGTVTAIGDNIIPAKINLGTTDSVEVEGKTATPKIWVTDLNSEEAKKQGINPNEVVTLLEDEEYFMIYSCKITVKMPDETGEMTEKEVEIEVNPDGEKKNPEKGEEGNGGIEFPENPKPPEGWTNPDDNTEFKGWVKGEENKDNPDAPVIDPETEIPEEGDEYFPKFTKTVTAIRYIYDKENEMQKVLKDENGKDLTGTVTAIGDNIIPAKINLGTTESIEINEKTATPRFWSTSSEADVTQNETSVELNAEAQIKETTKYYMSYSYDVTLAYHDGSSQQTKQIKVMVSSEGIVKGNEFTLEDPSVPEGWTTFIGWTKGNVSPNTTVIDKETEKVDGNEIYHATFTKEVTLTYDANSTGVSGLPSPQTATAYKNDVEEIYPKIIISQDKPQKNKREFKGWSNKSGESALVSYNAGTEIEIRDNKTIYAVWETYPIGDPQTYGDKVTYDVDINGNSDYSDDWIIYHYDGDYLYLISREYLPENKMPEALSTTMAVDRTYGFYWKSLSQSITLNNIQSTFMSRYFKIFDRNANYTNVNSRFISDLLNTNNWEGLKGKYGEEVIGSPTLELLHASYKAKYPNSPLAKQTLSADNSGYLIGGTISSGINTITGDNLYCILDTSKYNRYWLASPASLDTGETYKNAGLYAVGNMGQINGSAAVDSEGHVYGGALRPVIRLKGGISGKADENNNWEIEEPPFAGPKISVDTKNWTKKVTVTIDHIGDSGAVTEYSFTGDEGDWTTYESPFTVEEEDKTVYARTTFEGKEIRTSMSLSNIDITPPEVKDIYLEGTEVVSKMFDAKSGLTHAKAKVEGTSKYGSSTTDWTDLTTNNNGNPIVGRDYNVTYSNYYNVGTFTVYVKDAAGNETEMPKAISNPDNSPPVIELASSNVESDTSCPHCGKPAKPWVIEFSATEEGSGLTSLTTGQWQEEIVKEDVGFTVCKTCEESPQWGSKSGKYRMKLYVHNPTGGETTYNFSIQDIYGNESNKAVASVNFYESDNDPPTVELVSSKNLGTTTCPHCSKQAIHWQSTFRASDISGLRSCSTDWSQNSKELWNDCTRVSSSPADGAKSGTYVRDSYIHDLEASVQLYVDFTISDVTGHTSTPVRSTINLRGSDNIAPVVSLSSSQDLGIQNCPYCNSSARHWRVVINASDSGTGLYPFSSEWNIVNNSYYTGHFKTTSPDKGAKSGTYTEDLYFHNLSPVQCRKQYYALDLNDNQSNAIEVTMDLYP